MKHQNENTIESTILVNMPNCDNIQFEILNGAIKKSKRVSNEKSKKSIAEYKRSTRV